MKRNSLFKFTFATLLGLSSITTTEAQTFVPPTGIDHIYGSQHIRKPDNAFAYSNDYVESPWGVKNLYLAGWGTKEYLSEVTWIFTDLHSTNIVAKGSLLYKEVDHIVVSSVMDDAGNTQILVAYLRPGYGHFVDIYNLTNSTTNPIVWDTTMQLSDSPEGRISVEAFYKYRVAFVWEHLEANTIQTKLCEAGTWHPTKNLDATDYQHAPDIALSADVVHYVYHNDAGEITYSQFDYNDLTSPITTIYPILTDVNTTGLTIEENINIAAPDHMNYPGYNNGHNWGYTYTDYEKVYLRYIDYNQSGLLKDIVLNDGSLGNSPTVGSYKAYTPSIHYSINNPIQVDWYNTDGGGGDQRYIGLMVEDDGSTSVTILNSLDYMELPNSQAFNYDEYANLAVSRSDLELIDQYIYVVYTTYNSVTDEYELHHAFHDYMNTSEFKKSLQIPTSSTYPNPFTKEINMKIVCEKENVATIQLMDITGRVVTTQTASLNKGNNLVQLPNLEKLPAGNYILNTIIDSKIINTSKLVKQ